MPKPTTKKPTPTLPARTPAKEVAQHRPLVPDAASTPSSRRLDGWQSILSGYGTFKDKRMSTHFDGGTYISYSQQDLDAMYVNDDVFKRIVNIVANDMTRAGFKIVEDEKGQLSDKLTQLEFLKKIKQAIRDARLYGSSIMILGANDGRSLSSPLKEDRVKSFDFITVMHSFELRVARYYKDRAAPKYNEPELYAVNTVQYDDKNIDSKLYYNAKIHESRVIRFDGTETTIDVMRDNQGWAMPILQHLHDPIRDFQSSAAGLAVIVPSFSQDIIKIKNLADKLASDETNKDVMDRIQIMDLCRSTLGWIPLDAEHEDYDRKTTSVSGLADLHDRNAQKLSMATGMPVTLLTGISPGGLNSNGDNDQRNWYALIGSDQDTILRAPVTRAINLIARANGIKPAGGAGLFTIEFNPLWIESASERAKTRKTIAETDKIYVDANILDPDEIAVARFHNGYSEDITIDVDQRETPTADDQTPAPRVLDVEKISAYVEKVASGAMSPVAARNVLVELLGVTEDKADRLLNGVVPVKPEPVTTSTRQ